MKKIIITFSALTIALTLATSCSKSSSSDTSTKAQLVGTWSLYEYGQDANANGSLDAGEAVTTSSLGVSEIVTIKDDGSGSAHIAESGIVGNVDTTYPITWTLNSSTNALTIVGNGETTYGTIHSINSSSMTVITHDTSSGTPVDVWNVFNKQ